MCVFVCVFVCVCLCICLCVRSLFVHTHTHTTFLSLFVCLFVCLSLSLSLSFFLSLSQSLSFSLLQQNIRERIRERERCNGKGQPCMAKFVLLSITEIFGSTRFGNDGFSEITDILAIPELKFSIKKGQSNGFPRITDKMGIPTDPVLPKTSVFRWRESRIGERSCTLTHILHRIVEAIKSAADR